MEAVAVQESVVMAMNSEAIKGPVLDPVFVICNGRSGSTLLRFLLDAHPELACPPETNIPALCAQLATVWSLIEGAPLSAKRGDEPPDIPEAAIAGVRHTMDRMVGSYLGRREKQRYCDKSLGSARFADLLMRVYPNARFICLYRHPMDVIASGMEACPFGLNGYGFDPYIAETPGNAVLALSRFWVDNAAATLEVEERFPGRCHRLRYEDLVSDPERSAAELFSFLGVSPAPGITTACFSTERERFGPADYKIWYTSEVTGDSVGRGWSVPAGMIAEPVLITMNELAAKIGYRTVDGSWGTAAPPADMRVSGFDAVPGSVDAVPGSVDAVPGQELEPLPRPEPPSPDPAQVGLLGETLRTGLAQVTAELSAKWGPQAEETFVVIAVPPRPAIGAEYWLVDLKAGTVRPASHEEQEKSDWDVVGAADAWSKVISRKLNLNVAIRSCQLRYCDEAGAGPITADTRMSILADLLGIATWY
jgi:hypothetical protein